MKDIAKMIVNSKNNISRIRPNTIDNISSISRDSDGVNTETYNNAELRDVPIVSPYGISSLPVDNIAAQVVCNNGVNSVVGVMDPRKPKPNIGTIILYDKDNNTVSLTGDNIEIKHKSGSTITFDSNGDINIHSTGNINMTADGNMNANGMIIT